MYARAAPPCRRLLIQLDPATDGSQEDSREAPAATDVRALALSDLPAAQNRANVKQAGKISSPDVTRDYAAWTDNGWITNPDPRNPRPPPHPRDRPVSVHDHQATRLRGHVVGRSTCRTSHCLGPTNWLSSWRFLLGEGRQREAHTATLGRRARHRPRRGANEEPETVGSKTKVEP